MIFHETPLPGAYILEIEPVEDERGFFARTWCSDEFSERGLEPGLTQCSISFNAKQGTLRGMHYQIAPCEEAKLVRCTSGAIYDVIVDLRPGSPTRKRWYASELSAENRRSVYVPAGFSHGFQTRTDDVEVLYQISTRYSPAHARGHRYDDPGVGIVWPLPITNISQRDLSWPSLS